MWEYQNAYKSFGALDMRSFERDHISIYISFDWNVDQRQFLVLSIKWYDEEQKVLTLMFIG